MKRLISAVLWMVLCFAGSQAGAERLMIVSDTHFYAPECYEESKGIFESLISQSDGKMPQYSRELLEALELEAEHQHPDALIVTGDLSFNGEKLSHEDLAEGFRRIEEKGIPVWVIPGNHDINSSVTRKYTGYVYEETENVTPEEFARIYGDFMGDIAGGEAGDSYVVPLTEKLWLVMCDASVYIPEPQAAGNYPEGLRAWLRQTLAEAQRAGVQVITATHQSLVPHTRLLMDSMIIHGREKMLEDMIASGVCRLNLSGHLHIQHIAEEEGIWDIAAGAYALPPFRYGMLEIGEEGEITYQAGQVCPEHLTEEVRILAETWFEDVSRVKLQREMKKLGLPEEETEALVDYAVGLNHAYFSGTLDPADPAWQGEIHDRWLALSGQTSFGGYLSWVLESGENDRDALHLELPAF